jgi:hypothetical protein
VLRQQETVASDLTSNREGLGLCKLRNERPAHEMISGQEVLLAGLGGAARGSGSRMKGSTASTGVPLPSQGARVADRLRHEAPTSHLAEVCLGDSSMELACRPSAFASWMSHMKCGSTSSLKIKTDLYN